MTSVFKPEAYLSWLRLHAALTHRSVVLGLILTLGIATSAWPLIWLSAGATQQLLFGLALVSTSLASILFLLFLFAVTYAPLAVSQIQRRQSGAANVADRVSFTLLKLLAPYALHSDQAALDAGLKALWLDRHVRSLVRRLQLNSDEVYTQLVQRVLPAVTWEDIAGHSLSAAQKLGNELINAEHVIGAWLLHPAMKTGLREWGLREEDIEFMVWWEAEYRARIAEARAWWRPENLLRFSGVGLSWASGYTPFIDRFAYIPAGNAWDEVPIGRDNQIDQLITTLARSRQSNVLLVGQPGVGRLGVIREVDRRIRFGHAHPVLNDQRMVYVHLSELLGLADSGASQLAVISRALREMERSGNIVAVFDGLSSVLGQEGEARVNLTDVLLPFFSSRAIRVVAIVSGDEYHLRLINNPDLMELFEVVQVPSLSEEDTLRMLALVAWRIEAENGVYLPYRTLQAAVEGTSSILPHIPFPERAFDFLAEAIVVAQSRGQHVLEKEHIYELIAHKVGVPLGPLQEDERDRLLNLEELMHERIVNQETAVTAISRTMMRSRAGVRTLKRPIGTFLFLGPTGVGKTETSKTLAEVYFGAEEYMVRLDMSEYQGEDAVSRLIGSPSQPTGRLTALVTDHPFCVLLLDEFEKASREVHQLFLQVFDEGHLTNIRGQQVSFKHTIIIATSNAGAEFIRQAVQSGPLPPNFSKQLREHILQQAIFRPELLNRFDGVITFTPLTQEHLRQVATLMLRSLNKRLDARHGVRVAITPALIEYLISIGYNPEFGARPMARAIQDTVEYVMAERILRGLVHPGDEVQLTAAELTRVHAG
jgi:ATP-dependent Clp protease ATP-binding subunit ClpC